MRTTWLRGDYVDPPERQRQAEAEGCACAIDLHFNSFDDGRVEGGECFHRSGSEPSRRLAEALRDALRDVGLPLRPHSVQAAAGSRARFIDDYTCPAVLIEPLFLSSPAQARWLHEAGNLTALAAALAAALRAALPADALIGLSVGHRGKPSKPNDHGAACALGDTEADHAQALGEALAAALAGEG
jgi:N-acetylmuramoyl-L-alanine amidase